MVQKKIVNAIIISNFVALLTLNILGGVSLVLGFGASGSISSQSDSQGWLYEGWQYRKEHNITYNQANDLIQFYDLSNPWVTITGNPTGRHAFQPVRDFAIVEVDKIVDGATRKYLAYDSDPDGSVIRLYYTNDTSGSWTSYSSNPILGPSSYHYRWPSVAYTNGTFHMFLTDRTDGTLERWTSTDGIHYVFVEHVKTGGNQWKNPFIWYCSNESAWLLYHHDSSGTTEYFKVRSAPGIEDLDSSMDTVVIGRNMPFGSPTIGFYDGKYWLLGELLEGGIWKVVAYYSTTSPSSGFVECFNSPILTNDDCCPMLLSDRDSTHIYLFNSLDSSAWHEQTREVYTNGTTSPKLPNLVNYQIRITAHAGDGNDNGENVYLNGHSKSDFGDVRFSWLNYSSQSEVQCAFWIEKLEPNDSAVFWLKVPEIPSKANTRIYVYYGKDDALTTSNGDAAFEFFDDFNGTLSKWTTVGGTWKIENGELSAETNGFGQRLRATNLSFGNDSVHVNLKWISGTYFEHGPCVRGQSPNEQNDGYMTLLSTWAYDSRNRISKMLSGSETTLAGQGTTSPSKNVWYSFTFAAYENQLKSSITPIYANEINATDSSFASGTLSLFSWSGTSEHVHYDNLFVTKYVSPEPNHGGWGSEETGQYVLIDQSLVSDTRADTGTVQAVGFHAKWNNNGSDVEEGKLYVNNTEYVTDSSGWATLDVTSSTIGADRWVITGVNCSGITTYTQTSQTPSIIWDRIRICAGGITQRSLMQGQTTTIWFKALYEYDNQTFDSSHGAIYLNSSAMNWSTSETRWESTFATGDVGTTTFTISAVHDDFYNLTLVDDAIGPQTVTISALTFYVVSNSTISELVFDSTNKTLSFTASGPTGTQGFANVTIAKTLIQDANGLNVYLDGNQLNYTALQTEYSWQIDLSYHHSTHKIVIHLSSANVQIASNNLQELFGIIGLLIGALLATSGFILRKRRTNRLSPQRWLWPE
jgi:hypothetical protein